MNTGIVLVDVQMMDVGRGSTCLLFLNSKPAANFFGFAFNVMEIADEKLVRIDSDTWSGFQLPSGRIELPQSPG